MLYESSLSGISDDEELQGLCRSASPLRCPKMEAGETSPKFVTTTGNSVEEGIDQNSNNTPIMLSEMESKPLPLLSSAFGISVPPPPLELPPFISSLKSLPTHNAMATDGKGDEEEGPPLLSVGALVQQTNTAISPTLKEKIVEIGTAWIRFCHENQKKVLAETKRKLAAKYNIERETFRANIAEVMKTKLDSERAVIDAQLAEELKEQLARFNIAHMEKLTETKKKQWCKVCFQEAQYACCWNVAYCGAECQARHWPMHQRTCRRVAAIPVNSQQTGEPTH